MQSVNILAVVEEAKEKARSGANRRTVRRKAVYRQGSPQPKSSEKLLDTRPWAVTYGVVGLLVCIAVLAEAGGSDPGRFLIYLASANVAAASLRLTSNQNVLPAGFLFLLLGIVDLSLSELLFVALSMTIQREVRAVVRPRDMLNLLYSVASVTVGVILAQAVYQVAWQLADSALFPTPIILSATVLMLNNSLAATLLLNPNESALSTYRRECRPLLPWMVLTAYLAYLVQTAAQHSEFHPALIVLPILFTLDRGYRMWTDAVAQRKEEFATLHRNTLETLALAIDARDQTTHMHLRRVQICALAVGRELGLSEAELEALNVAALLHDIGKLGIPDHILLKPGSLTPQEWQKMKTHAAIGAEMLSRMHFPDLVSSIVLTHHEKWDGTGYPAGLKGNDIPIGARILSAVDCLDALASDRPYRTALSLDDAMAMVRNEAGKSYDPSIIAILERRFKELEEQARAEVGSAPASGAASTAPSRSIVNLKTRLDSESKTAARDILDPILAARQETRFLQALASSLAHLARLDEVVSAIHKCLGQMIRYDTLGIYVRRGQELDPVYFIGDHASQFTKQAFPASEGLSGWVAQHGTSILNGNVSLESCYSNDSVVLLNLQAGLAVPFTGRGGATGVITLYHLDRNAFTADHLRILEAASNQIGAAVEGALKFQDAEESAVTDHLTGIPNARALEIYLARELERAGLEESTVGVVVCDLDGFKQVNDRFGHLTGNEVLQHVAHGLRAASRGSDYLARMGGDEFVVVLPGLQGDYTSQIERLKAVAVKAGEAVCGEQCLSMSVGVAIYPSDGLDAESLIAEADRRMYRFKHEHKTKYDRGYRLADDAESSIEKPLV